MRRLLLLSMALLLAGCAGIFQGHDFAPGTPREAVIARLGPPGRVVPLAQGGQRLQYSLQPMGRAAWMVDLDAAGRVVQSRQVLTAREFARIEAGAWTRADVEREFGRPASVDTVASWRGPVLTYRWHEQSNMFYAVYLDERDVVQRSHPGIEPEPDPPEWR